MEAVPNPFLYLDDDLQTESRPRPLKHDVFAVLIIMATRPL